MSAVARRIVTELLGQRRGGCWQLLDECVDDELGITISTAPHRRIILGRAISLSRLHLLSRWPPRPVGDRKGLRQWGWWHRVLGHRDIKCEAALPGLVTYP